MSGGATVLLADVTAKVFSVDTGSFLAIVVTAAVAGTVAAVAGGRGLFLPVVVLELVFGVVIGPQGLGLAQVNGFTGFFSDLGLGMLFFFAGYEIDIPRIRGQPLRLALIGWAMSLAIAYGLGGALAAAGVVVSLVYVGSALATTAIGTLLPVLSDTGELDTEFGTYLLAAGAVGEFGPVLLLTLVLSTQSAFHNAVILIAFIGLAVAVALLAVRSSARTMPLFERTIEKSSQLAVRWIVVLVFALGLLASNLGLDLLLGGFAAGLITRLVLRKHEVPGFDSKLTAVAFGVFIPFFFVVSGMRLDVDALFASPSSVGKLLLFFVLFLVVRGTPALLLYRGVLPLREDRMALALFSATQLPLIVAITTVAVQAGHMRSSTAAALVGAGALSTLAGPLHGLHMRKVAALKRPPEHPAEAIGGGSRGAESRVSLMSLSAVCGLAQCPCAQPREGMVQPVSSGPTPTPRRIAAQGTLVEFQVNLRFRPPAADGHRRRALLRSPTTRWDSGPGGRLIRDHREAASKCERPGRRLLTLRISERRRETGKSQGRTARSNPPPDRS